MDATNPIVDPVPLDSVSFPGEDRLAVLRQTHLCSAHLLRVTRERQQRPWKSAVTEVMETLKEVAVGHPLREIHVVSHRVADRTGCFRAFVAHVPKQLILPRIDAGAEIRVVVKKGR